MEVLLAKTTTDPVLSNNLIFCSHTRKLVTCTIPYFTCRLRCHKGRLLWQWQPETKTHRYPYIPAQDWALQPCVCWAWPVHWLPPWRGGGFVQVRLLFCSPVPHDFEHVVHAVHLLHWPSTVFESERTLSDNQLIKQLSNFSCWLSWNSVV